MKTLAFLCALLSGVAILIACCDDPPGPPPPPESVVGEYTGWLIYDSLSLTGGFIDSQPSEWVFTRDSFTYTRPDSIPDSVPYLYADCFGAYKLTDGLVLTADCAPIANQRSTPRTVLHGTFVILELSKTKLVFVQGGVGGVTTTVRLKGN
jgi:hypothetical protein